MVKGKVAVKMWKWFDLRSRGELCQLAAMAPSWEMEPTHSQMTMPQIVEASRITSLAFLLARSLAFLLAHIIFGSFCVSSLALSIIQSFIRFLGCLLNDSLTRLLVGGEKEQNERTEQRDGGK